MSVFLKSKCISELLLNDVGVEGTIGDLFDNKGLNKKEKVEIVLNFFNNQENEFRSNVQDSNIINTNKYKFVNMYLLMYMLFIFCVLICVALFKENTISYIVLSILIILINIIFIVKRKLLFINCKKEYNINYKNICNKKINKRLKKFNKKLLIHITINSNRYKFTKMKYKELKTPNLSNYVIK